MLAANVIKTKINPECVIVPTVSKPQIVSLSANKRQIKPQNLKAKLHICKTILHSWAEMHRQGHDFLNTFQQIKNITEKRH